MSKVYRVAIIGTGMICNAAHIPAYKAMGDKVKNRRGGGYPGRSGKRNR